MTLRIAIIGAGAVATYGHLPAVTQSDRWHLRAIVETDPARLAQAAQTFPADHALAHPEALRELDDLDVVVVATHLDSHRPLVVEALSRGCHVLCEKPMAATLEDCQAMVAAAEQHGRLLAINFNTRSQNAYRAMLDVVRTGRLGPIAVARFAYLWSCHQWQPPERLAAFMANGGPIVDSGVHFFDGVRLFTGQDFTHIDAQGAYVTGDRHPQHVIATCKLDGGAIALVEAGWLYTRNTRTTDAIYHVELIGRDGALRADLSAMEMVVHDQQGCERHALPQEGKGFGWIYDQLADSVQAGRLLGLASGQDGLAATQAAFDALGSAHRHRPGMGQAGAVAG